MICWLLREVLHAQQHDVEHSCHVICTLVCQGESSCLD